MDIGKVIAISISKMKGVRKKSVREAFLIEDLGIKNDAHAEGGLRQVSLLMDESIEKMKEQGMKISYGDFAENIVTWGINLKGLKIDDTLRIGEEAELVVTKIGKECLAPCSIYYQVGYCIMPIEGIFCRVKRSGNVRLGDEILLKRA